MSNNPIETASDELKKWLEQLQKYYQFKIDEEKKAQALAKEQAKEALAAERHEEMMEELRGMREGKTEAKDFSSSAIDLDEEYIPPAPEVEYDYESEVKEARKFKEQLEEFPDGDEKAQLLREKGPEARKMFDDYKKQVEDRPDSLGKEVLLKELDEIDEMLDYEAYAQEHGIDGEEIELKQDVDAETTGNFIEDAGDIADGLEDVVEGMEKAAEQLEGAAEQVGQGMQQAAGALAGGAGGAPAVAAPAAAAVDVDAPQMKPFKPNSVGAALKDQGYPVKRPGGTQIQAPKQNTKVSISRR